MAIWLSWSLAPKTPGFSGNTINSTTFPSRKRLIKSPKIYFYDPGLASFLMNINDSKQIDTHPLKGNLYEKMILSELIKNRFNQGMINNLLFYRNSNGNEVDVVIPSGNSYTAIEIKASNTITNSFLRD